MPDWLRKAADGGVHADQGGLAAGRDIRDNTINMGLDEDGVRRLLKEELAAISFQPCRRRVDEIFARHQVFGGREAELLSLNQFITNRPGGYLFVTGPTGFGKTALLANWIRSIDVERFDICCHFISRPDGMADQESTLANLCQQLIKHHGVHGSLPTRISELRSCFFALLTRPPVGGKRVVVVVDGLEEALDWTPAPAPDLFPRSLPEGVHVVFSAGEVSERDWLASLGMSDLEVARLTLGALQAEHIASLLRGGTAGEFKVPISHEMIDDLLTTSHGDPTYVRFMLEDLRDGVTTDDDLTQQPRGFKAYLDRWWQQLNQDVSLEPWNVDLLGVLSVAKGPLRLQDLAGIAPSLRSGPILRARLGGKLGRYLVGSPEMGYALGHRRFAEYLRKVFLPEETHGYLEQTLAYCARWEEHKSAYALAHYPVHLSETGRYEELLALIGKEWMDAQFERTHSPLAFSADVDLTLAVATTALGIAGNEASFKNIFVFLIGGCFLYATLKSFASTVPVKALASLAHSGEYDRAGSYAALLAKPDQQVEAYGEIAIAMHQRGHTTESLDMLEVVAAIAREGHNAGSNQESEGTSNAMLLAAAARFFVSVDQRDKAEKLADEAVSVALSQDMEQLDEVAKVLAGAGLVDAAARAIEAIPDPYGHRISLAPYFDALIKSGQVDRATQLCTRATGSWDQVVHWVSLTFALLRAGDPTNATCAAQNAESAAHATEDSWYKPCLLAQAARGLKQVGMSDRFNACMQAAWDLAITEPDANAQSWSVSSIARACAQIGNVTRASEISKQLANSTSDTAGRLRAAASPLAAAADTAAYWSDGPNALSFALQAQDLGLAEESRQESETFVPQDQYNVCFGSFAVQFALPEAGFTVNSEPILVQVAKRLAEKGNLEWALKAAAALPSVDRQQGALPIIVKALLGADRVDEAITVAQTIALPKQQCNAFAELAMFHAQKKNYRDSRTAAQRAIALALSPSNPYSSSWALNGVVSALCDADKFDAATEAAHVCTNPRVKAWALVDLAIGLARGNKGELARAAADEAMKTAAESPPSETSVQFAEMAALTVPDGATRLKIHMRARLAPRAVGRGLVRVMNRKYIAAPVRATDQLNVGALVLPELAQALVSAKDEQHALRTIAGLLESLPTDDPVASRLPKNDLARSQAALALALINRPGDAFTVAGALNGSPREAHTLAMIAAAFVRIGELDRAVALTRLAAAATECLRDRLYYGEVMTHTVTTLAAAGLFDEILTTQEQIDAHLRLSLDKEGGLLSLLESLVQTGDSTRAAQLASRSASIAKSESERIEAASAAAGVGRREQAASVVGGVLDTVESSVDHQAQSGQPDRARPVPETIHTPEVKLRTLTQTSLALWNAGRKKEAVAAARQSEALIETLVSRTARIESYRLLADTYSKLQEGILVIDCLLKALLQARFADREAVLELIERFADAFASLDRGETLAGIHKSLLSIDSWFQSETGLV